MAPGDMGGYHIKRGGKLRHARNVPESIFNTLIVGFGILLFVVVLIAVIVVDTDENQKSFNNTFIITLLKFHQQSNVKENESNLYKERNFHLVTFFSIMKSLIFSPKCSID